MTYFCYTVIKRIQTLTPLQLEKVYITIAQSNKSLQLLSSDELDFIIASVCTGQA